MFYGYKDEEHRRQGENLTAALGRFVISFERVCSGMRSCIHEIFSRGGLNNQGLTQVIVGKKQSNELQVLLGALYHEFPGQSEKDKKCVNKLISDIKSLTEERNDILHSEWLLGDEAGEEELVALLLKPDMGQKKGANLKIREEGVSNIEKLIHEATRIQILLRRLQICITQKGFNVSDDFDRPM